MSKEDLIHLEGVVIRVLGRGTMEIECDNNMVGCGVLSGQMKKHSIEVIKGDREEEGGTMFELDEKEVLFRVRRYDMFRKDGRLCVDVEETIAGKSKYRFYAVPGRFNRLTNEGKYMGVGDSEVEALKDCLRRIKGVPTKEIVPLPSEHEGL